MVDIKVLLVLVIIALVNAESKHLDKCSFCNLWGIKNHHIMNNDVSSSTSLPVTYSDAPNEYGSSTPVPTTQKPFSLPTLPPRKKIQFSQLKLEIPHLSLHHKLHYLSPTTTSPPVTSAGPVETVGFTVQAPVSTTAQPFSLPTLSQHTKIQYLPLKFKPVYLPLNDELYYSSQQAIRPPKQGEILPTPVQQDNQQLPLQQEVQSSPQNHNLYYLLQKLLQPPKQEEIQQPALQLEYQQPQLNQEVQYLPLHNKFFYLPQVLQRPVQEEMQRPHLSLEYQQPPLNQEEQYLPLHHKFYYSSQKVIPHLTQEKIEHQVVQLGNQQPQIQQLNQYPTQQDLQPPKQELQPPKQELQPLIQEEIQYTPMQQEVQYPPTQLEVKYPPQQEVQPPKQEEQPLKQEYQYPPQQNEQLPKQEVQPFNSEEIKSQSQQPNIKFPPLQQYSPQFTVVVPPQYKSNTPSLNTPYPTPYFPDYPQ